MSLSIGIVGLPNVGKSTLFNALLKRQVALAANYPFATIEPNVGIVDVPDERLNVLAQIVKNDFQSKAGDREVPEKIIPAVVKFVDIAGLVKGASQGEGLGNQFLSHIREVDAIAHVVRSFEDENVLRAGSVNPKEDFEVILTELILADLPIITKHLERGKSLSSNEKHVLEQLLDTLNNGQIISLSTYNDEEIKFIKTLNLLTSKPLFIILNVSESDINKKITQIDGFTNIVVSAKIESELSTLDETDRLEYMASLNMIETGLDKVISTGYKLLGLHTFLTAGPKEVRAWTMPLGTKAPQAAGVIHTDFERGFISASIVSYDNLKSSQSLKKAKELGVYRLEGKTYVMQDGDVVEFNFSV